MKINFKYNVYHVKKKRIFKSIEINLIWKYRNIKIEILKPKKELLIKEKMKPGAKKKKITELTKDDFYLMWIENLFIKEKRFIAELLPGSKRKKNKLTWFLSFRFFNFSFVYDRIKIIRKHLYRKILKERGLLKNETKHE